MQTTVTLQANRTFRLQVAGRFFLLESTGAATSLRLRFDLGGRQNAEEFDSAKRGLKLTLQAERFQSIDLTSSVDAQVSVITSDNDIDIDLLTGTAVTATIANLPLPVTNDRGSPGNLLYVSGVSLSDAPATSATAAAPIAVAASAVVLATANANRRELRMKNLGPDPIAIGPAGQTWAQRVVVLEADELWIENRGANLAWSAIADTAKTASVTVQQVLA